MTAAVFRRDVYFYPLAFAVWGFFMLMRFGSHVYFDKPLPSATVSERVSGTLSSEKQAEQSIAELHESFATETDEAEKGHIHHNIGTAYYDIYKVTGSSNYLDSARIYFMLSLQRVPGVARLHYNLGRVFTEQRDHIKAKAAYEKALEMDSTHILALHNLGLLNHFELGRRQEAKDYLVRALSIRPYMPICNFVLGDIAVSEGDFVSAVRYFNAEIETYTQYQRSAKGLPVSEATMRYALGQAHYRLALIHSTKVVNQRLAQINFHAYLKLEPDPQKREAALRELKRYWVME